MSAGQRRKSCVGRPLKKFPGCGYAERIGGIGARCECERFTFLDPVRGPACPVRPPPAVVVGLAICVPSCSPLSATPGLSASTFAVASSLRP